MVLVPECCRLSYLAHYVSEESGGDVKMGSVNPFHKCSYLWNDLPSAEKVKIKIHQNK